MDLNTIGSWASVISLPLSVYALYQAASITKAIRRHALDSRVSAMFTQLRALKDRGQLTTKARKDVVTLLRDLEDFYLSKIKFVDDEPKNVAKRIKDSLLTAPDMAELKRDLATLESLIFTSRRI